MSMSGGNGQWYDRKCGRGALHVNGAEKQAVVALRAPEYSSDNALQGAVAGVVDLQMHSFVMNERTIPRCRTKEKKGRRRRGM